MKYENFVKDQTQQLEKVYDCLGLNNLSSMVGVRSDTNQKYFDKWIAYQNHVARKWYARLILKKFESRVNQFGYSLKDLEIVI